MSRRWARLAPGFLAVVATYVQFLLWAQFGFLTLLKSRLPGPAEIQLAMGLMGGSGLVASLATAALLARLPGRRVVLLGLAASGLGALAAIPASGLLLYVASSWIGVATAVITVALAAHLPRLFPGPRLGLKVGAATGVAYFLCNLPALFSAPPAAQAAAVALLCGLAAWGLARPAEPEESAEKFAAGAPIDLAWSTGRGLVGATLALLLLVGLDSAAFAWIQATPGFKLLTWGGGWLKPIQGTTHLLAAVAAGALLDRGRVSTLLASTWLLFATAFTLLGLSSGLPTSSAIAGPLYAVGISFYSVVLVMLPAAGAGSVGLGEGEWLGRGRSPRHSPSEPSPAPRSLLLPPRWRAAILFGVAGWIGSALGVGMAQDLGAIPRGLLLAAGALIAVALLLVASARRPKVSKLPELPSGAVAGALGFLVLALPSALAPLPRPIPAGDPVARGRAVYVAEGCIHCHSQYVRPESPDEALWGPHRPLDRAEFPVLIGNRRQGPDLANVGGRRHPTWQRLHLAEPRAFSPHSRMPSYAHLFAGDGQRGADLVAYLTSLGRFSKPLPFEVSPLPGSRERGAALFLESCAACHGETGRGDGRFAAELKLPAVNLGKEALWFVREDVSGQDRLDEITRLIRDGIPGTPMAGHETITAQELADLAAFVNTLPGTAPASEEPLALSPFGLASLSLKIPRSLVGTSVEHRRNR